MQDQRSKAPVSSQTARRITGGLAGLASGAISGGGTGMLLGAIDDDPEGIGTYGATGAVVGGALGGLRGLKGDVGFDPWAERREMEKTSALLLTAG